MGQESTTRGTGEIGTASVEQVGLVALIAAVALAAVIVLTTESGGAEDRGLASTLARKIRCAARAPAPCWRDPLTSAYGRPLAGAVRALAPIPAAIRGPAGEGLVGVDFRRCRRPSCAIPAPGSRGARLTSANRRIAAFTSVEDDRRSGGPVRITYWIYRPTMAWARVVREASSEQVRSLAPTPLLDSASPRLVPLETLPGRNHVSFSPLEEPPWRWQVESVVPD